MKYRNVMRKYGVRAAAGAALLVPGLVLAQSTSFVPAAASGMFTQMGTDFTTLFGYGFAVLVTIVGSLLAWKYTRKIGSKV